MNRKSGRISNMNSQKILSVRSTLSVSILIKVVVFLDKFCSPPPKERLCCCCEDSEAVVMCVEENVKWIVRLKCCYMVEAYPRLSFVNKACRLFNISFIVFLKKN